MFKCKQRCAVFWTSITLSMVICHFMLYDVGLVRNVLVKILLTPSFTGSEMVLAALTSSAAGVGFGMLLRMTVKLAAGGFGFERVDDKDDLSHLLCFENLIYAKGAVVKIPRDVANHWCTRELNLTPTQIKMVKHVLQCQTGSCTLREQVLKPYCPQKSCPVNEVHDQVVKSGPASKGTGAGPNKSTPRLATITVQPKTECCQDTKKSTPAMSQASLSTRFAQTSGCEDTFHHVRSAAISAERQFTIPQSCTALSRRQKAFPLVTKADEYRARYPPSQIPTMTVDPGRTCKEPARQYGSEKVAPKPNQGANQSTSYDDSSYTYRVKTPTLSRGPTLSGESETETRTECFISDDYGNPISDLPKIDMSIFQLSDEDLSRVTENRETDASITLSLMDFDNIGEDKPMPPIVPDVVIHRSETTINEKSSGGGGDDGGVTESSFKKVSFDQTPRLHVIWESPENAKCGKLDKLKRHLRKPKFGSKKERAAKGTPMPSGRYNMNEDDEESSPGYPQVSRGFGHKAALAQKENRRQSVSRREKLTCVRYHVQDPRYDSLSEGESDVEIVTKSARTESEMDLTKRSERIYDSAPQWCDKWRIWLEHPSNGRFHHIAVNQRYRFTARASECCLREETKELSFTEIVQRYAQQEREAPLGYVKARTPILANMLAFTSALLTTAALGFCTFQRLFLPNADTLIYFYAVSLLLIFHGFIFSTMDGLFWSFFSAWIRRRRMITRRMRNSRILNVPYEIEGGTLNAKRCCLLENELDGVEEAEEEKKDAANTYCKHMQQLKLEQKRRPPETETIKI